MEISKTPEERKEELFAEESEAITREFTRVGNKWCSCVMTRLTLISANVFLDKEDGKLPEEIADKFFNDITDFEHSVRESLQSYVDAELPPEELRTPIINRLVELKYEIEQATLQNE